MKKIKLRQGGFDLKDEKDFELIGKWKWWIDKDGYARRWTPQVNWKRTNILMHREILGLGKQDKIYIDHINRNKLDNRRSNLRIATKSQNGLNREESVGVSWRKERNKWRARITINGKEQFLGHFNNWEEAIQARKEANKLIWQ